MDDPAAAVPFSDQLMREIARLEMISSLQIAALNEKLDAETNLTAERFAAVKVKIGDHTLAAAESLTAVKELMTEKFMSRDLAQSAGLLSAKEAVDKAHLASERRFEGVNEFRAQLSDIIGTMMPRNETTTMVGSLESKISDIKSIVDKGFTNVDTRNSTVVSARADTRANLAIAISVAMGVLTILTMILVNAMHATGH